MYQSPEIKFGKVLDFKRNTENLRESLESEQLVEQIRVLKGVIEPILCLRDSDDNLVILEGNRRHYAMESLENDPEYDGETDIPYIELTDMSELNQIQFQLSLGSLSKKLKPLEYWRGIQKQIDLALVMAEQGDPKYKKLIGAENPRMLALPIIASELGVTRQWLYLCNAVFSSDCTFLNELLETNNITINTADKFILASKRYEIELADLLKRALILAMSDRKSKLTEKYLNLVIESLQDDKALKEIDSDSEIDSQPDSESEIEYDPNAIAEALEILSHEILRGNIAAKDVAAVEKLCKRILK